LAFFVNKLMQPSWGRLKVRKQNRLHKLLRITFRNLMKLSINVDRHLLNCRHSKWLTNRDQTIRHRKQLFLKLMIWSKSNKMTAKNLSHLRGVEVLIDRRNSTHLFDLK
jgi:hypothetical protein